MLVVATVKQNRRRLQLRRTKLAHTVLTEDLLRKEASWLNWEPVLLRLVTKQVPVRLLPSLKTRVTMPKRRRLPLPATLVSRGRGATMTWVTVVQGPCRTLTAVAWATDQCLPHTRDRLLLGASRPNWESPLVPVSIRVAMF